MHAAILAGLLLLLPSEQQSVPQSTPSAVPFNPARVSKEKQAELDRLQKESLDALLARNFMRSEEATRRLISLDPGNFVHYYNLACLRSLQHDPAGAGEQLVKAVERGFCDIHQLRRDPQLDPVRDDPNYRTLIDNWDAILDARLQANLQQTATVFKAAKYESSRDDHLRLAYHSAFDPRAFDEARAELSLLAQWAEEHVMPGLLDPEDSKLDPWVVVVLPNRFDFGRWSFSTYGTMNNNGLSAIGGSYEHDYKRLVAQDLGGTLRHEFFHVLHWRSMTRRGQFHPMWIQEGLCSLVEDYDIAQDGSLQPAPSWRSNTAKRMEKSRNLVPLVKLLKSTHQEFMGGRRMALYAQSRTFFLFLWQKGCLRDWYTAYTDDYKSDPSGLESLEKVFKMPIADIDKDFRAWLRELPEVPEEMKRGMASLGVEVDAGTGEGPRVVAVSHSTGRRVDLQQGDIITSIQGRPTRDLPELLRVLGSYRPHDIVEVAFRRGKVHHTTEVPLVEFGGN